MEVWLNHSGQLIVFTLKEARYSIGTDAVECSHDNKRRHLVGNQVAYLGQPTLITASDYTKSL